MGFNRIIASAQRPLILGLAAMAIFVSLFAGGKAAAEYTFCNKTSYALSASIGYVDDDNLVTRGWWRLRAGECKRVLSETLDVGRYFVYAEAIPGHLGPLRTWSGRVPLCVQNDSLFTLRDQDVCTDDPRRQRNFLPVDVTEDDNGIQTTDFVDENNFSVFASEVAGVQRLMADLDIFEGGVDGALGQATRNALSRYQRSKGLGTSGQINDEVIDALISDANRADAQRGFFFCNSTMLPVWAAFAQPMENTEDETYTSSGWWRLESQECAKVRRGTLAGNDYYVYGVMEAENRSVPLAGGNERFCVSSVQFEADNDTECTTEGYDEATFLRVQTGDEDAWTFQFTPELFNPDLAGR